MQLLEPMNWKDYELIDTGNYEKLERFGKYILTRPEPQAVWNKTIPEKEWEAMSDATFKQTKASKDGSERGEWSQKKSMPDQWIIQYDYKGMHLKFRLGLTSFKHVGIFPEQSENWDFIYDSLQGIKKKVDEPKVLNLFAYTGGASIAAKSGGADVTHVDSIKQVVTWARENMENSGLENIRWVVEDALKFARREVKRGKKYNGIILDPPAYGHGPNGEKWKLEDNIAEILFLCKEMLEKTNSFLILNLYSMGFSPLIAENLIKDYFPHIKSYEFGELLIPEKSGKKLPLSVYIRFRS